MNINASKSKQVAEIISQQLITNETFITQISNVFTVENVVNGLIKKPEFMNLVKSDIENMKELAKKLAPLLAEIFEAKTTIVPKPTN